MRPNVRFLLAVVCLGISSVAAAQTLPPANTRPTAKSPHPANVLPRTIQSRSPQPALESLRKQYFELHFAGMHPAPSPEFGGARAGSKLFQIRKDRAQALAVRIRQNAIVSAPASSVPAVLPGLVQHLPLSGSGTIPTAMVSGDFNNDGHLDFAVANGGSNDIWIYFGNGDNTFQLPRIVTLTRGIGPVSMAAADLRHNGKLDLVVDEISTGTVGVLLGNGDGTFATEVLYSVPNTAGAVTVNDFNHDGKPDIAVVLVNTSPTTAAQQIAVLPGNSDGTFGQPIISNSNNVFGETLPVQATIDSGDINKDGYPDLLLVQPLYQTPGGIITDVVVPYINDGDGTFKEGSPLLWYDGLAYPTDARLADVNNDGCPDALIADLGEVVWVALGDCSGNFGALNWTPMGGPATTIRVADVNGDGNPDLVTGSAFVQQADYTYPLGTTVGVALGDGKGNFGTARVYLGSSEESAVAVGDFADNARPSIVTADVDTDTVTLFPNDGNADFGAPEGITYYGKAPALGYTFADLNGDGKPDVFQLGSGFSSIASLNDGKGRLSAPILSQFGAAASQQYMGDYRLGDFRNTGHLDMVGIGVSSAYSVSSQDIWFQPGNGDGTFGPATMVPTPGAGGSMTTGDFNSDGKLDFVAINGAQTHTMTPFFGNGNGTFRAGTAVTFTDQNEDITRVYSGDFNRDGKTDVIVFATSNGYWEPYLAVWEIDGNGDGTFQTGRELYDSFQPFTLAEVNKDGHPDIVRYDTMWPDGTTETDEPPKITTYLGQADGTFLQSSSYVPYPSYIPINLAPYLEFGDPTPNSLAADYSGDGNIDVAALQQGNGRFVQFLAGLGDGTLLPTYDVFPFFGYTYPLYATDLNQDGRADAVMYDNGGGTTVVLPGAPAPALQMALLNTVIQGSSNCGVVFANVPSSSSRTVALSSSVAGVLLPSSVAMPAGALNAQFCYTLAPDYDQTRVHDIRATLDGDTAVTWASQAYVPPFGISVSPTTTDPVYEGSPTAPVTVSINPQGSYTGTVTLGCSGMPSGFSCTFTPDQATVSAGTPATAQLVVQTAPDYSGKTPITILADDGKSIERQTLNLEIASLYLFVLPNPYIQAPSPGTASNTFMAFGIPPITFGCSGLPAGATCQFSGTQNMYPTASNITVAVSVPAGVTPANSNITINAQSGGLSAQATETLSIFSFVVQAPTAEQDWAPSPSFPLVTFPVQSANLSGAILSLGCALDGSTVCDTTGMGVSGPTTSIQYTLNIPAGLTPGKHTLTLSGTVAGSPQNYSFPFWIADFSGSLDSNSVTMHPSGSATVTGTLNAMDGFSSTVTLSCSAPSQLTCNFQPSSISLVGGTPAKFTLTLQADTFAANHITPYRGRPISSPALALLFPAGLALFGIRKRWRRIALLVVISCAIGFGLSSCGGASGGGTSGSGGGGGGGGKSQTSTYTVGIVARDSVRGISHNIGSITVTVNK